MPAAKITTRSFSRCRIARRRMYGSATSAIVHRGEDPGRLALVLEGVLEGEGIDDGRRACPWCPTWPGPCPAPAPVVPRQMLPPPTMTASWRSSSAGLGRSRGRAARRRRRRSSRRRPTTRAPRRTSSARPVGGSPTDRCLRLVAPLSRRSTLRSRSRPERTGRPRPSRACRRSTASRPWRSDWSSRTRSLNQPFSRPSTIFARAASGLPSLPADRLDRRPLGGDLVLRHVLPAEVAGRAKAMWTAMSWASSSVPPRSTTSTALTPRPACMVQVGVERPRPASLDPDDPADRDVLLAACVRSSVDVVLALGHRLLALGRPPGAASSSASATNSAALATKSVSQRSSTIAATPPSRTTRHRALGRLAVRPAWPRRPAPSRGATARPASMSPSFPRGPAWRRACRRRWPGAAPGRPWR